MSIASLPEKSIELNNVGPIDHLSIPIPPDGGVVVLNGKSGEGKTTALTAVSALTDSNARKSLRSSDGFPSGTIEGLGVTVRLSRSNTIKGELECASLDSGIDPSILVDPGLKDPVAADSKRLAMLVRLSGIVIDAGKWAQSAGKWGDEIAVKDLVSDDPIQTADRIRRRLHDIALKNEKIATSKTAEASALFKSVADVPRDIPSVDYLELLQRAQQYSAELTAKRNLFLNSSTAIEKAKTALESANQLDIDINEIHAEIAQQTLLHHSAEQHKQQRVNDIANLRAKIIKLEEEFSAFQTASEIAKAKLESANQRLGDAEFHAEEIQRLTKAVNASIPADATEAEFEAAKLLNQNAVDGLQQQRVVERAMATRATAEALSEEASALTSDAETIRTLARSTDHVLEQALVDAGFDTVKVHDGRLCVKSNRGLEPVSELSTGERWRLALDLAAKGLPKGALLSVQQEGWQSLDYGLRTEVAAMAKERGLVIVTACVNEGELRAEVL